MKNTTLALITVAALASSSALAATTSSTGAYAGGNLGYSNIDLGPGKPASTSTDGLGYNLHGGYMFNQYIGAELGYTKYADTDAAGGGHYSLDSVYLAAKGVYYFQPQWSAFADLGTARMTGSIGNSTNHDMALYLGAGLGYDVAPNFTVNVGWNYGNGGNSSIDDVGDANFFYTGVDYHF